MAALAYSIPISVQTQDEDEEAEQWLNGLLREARRRFIQYGKEESQYGQTYVITPARGRAIIKRNNPRQRPENAAHRKEVGEEMESGNWKASNEPVTFNWDGELDDGQHRIEALIERNLTIRLFLSFNADPAAYPNRDTGFKRTAANALTYEGFENGKDLAAAVRALFMIEQSTSRTALNNRQVIEHVQSHPDMGLAIRLADRIYKSTKAAKAGLSAGLYLIANNTAFPSRLDKFIQIICDGQTEERTPLIKLRDALNQKDYKTNSWASTSKEAVKVAAMLVAGWNAYIGGRANYSVWRKEVKDEPPSTEPFPMVL